MKSPRYTDQDETMQLVIMPVFIFILNWILLDQYYWQGWRVFVFATLTVGILGYVNWIVNNAIGLYAYERFPKSGQTLTRIAFLLVLCLLTNGLCVTLVYGCYVLADSPTLPLHPGRFGWAWLYEFLNVFIVIAIYESIIAFNRWEQTLRETEQLKKVTLQSQFDSLKSQINPHFLFNSLNTLSSLIEDDPERAEQFVEEMSSVYRYLLRSNETQLVTLTDELAFARSYFHLLRTRYGEYIRLEESVHRCYDEYLLPPLTLQLLLENTVKHNIILPEQPLHIYIETIDNSPTGQTGGHLVVRNNLQRKTSRVLSDQVGLANIATQYRLLGGGEIRVCDDDRFFSVTLPLIRQN